MPSSKKLRLLFISTDREIFREGSEARDRMRDYASVLDELTIIVFAKHSLHLKSTKIAPNCTAYPTNSWSRWFYVFSAHFLAKKIFSDQSGTGEKGAIDLVSTQDPFECGLAGFFISKSLRVPLHLQIHTDFLNDYFLRGSRLNFVRILIARFLFRGHADIRAVSERIKISVFKKMKFRQNAYPRIEVLPVFVDKDRFKNAEDTVHLSEKYIGYDLLVLVVARLEKEKNVEMAIQLVKEARNRNQEPLIGLVIVGDGSEKKKLKKLANSLGIADRVFFEGAVADPAPYYKSADVLLVTSHYEGYGRQIAEAVAAGCLVATLDVGVAKEIVGHSSGVVCGEDDYECLLHNLLFLANSSVIKKQLKDSARTAAKRTVNETKEEYLRRCRELWERALRNDEYIPFT